jgi:hypothetical protein
MGSFDYTFPESQQITNGTNTELRWCDWVAISLSNGKHISFAPFNPFAAVARRDEAIANMKARLQEN